MTLSAARVLGAAFRRFCCKTEGKLKRFKIAGGQIKEALMLKASSQCINALSDAGYTKYSKQKPKVPV